MTNGPFSDAYDAEDFDEDELPKRNPVYCIEARGVLNLDADNLGYPHLPGLWKRLLADRRRVPERGLWCPTCIKARPSQPEWMYVYERSDGLKIAAHHSPNHRAHDNESPEHQAYKERIFRAAELGGHHAEMEKRTADGKLRSDVEVTGAGGKKFGFEPQLSYGTVQSIQKRDRSRREHDITPVWHITDPKAPLIDHVQWARTDNLPVEAIRSDRDLLVRGGVRTLELETCDSGNPLPCPVKKVGRCGQLHPAWVYLGRQLDDMVRDIAAGELVTVVEKTGNHVRRFWAPAEDRARYLDNGGLLLLDTPEGARDLDPGRRRDAPARREAQCTKDRVNEFVPSSIAPRDSREALRPAVTILAGTEPVAPDYPRREAGPCASCHAQHHRYGVGGRPLCPVCSDRARLAGGRL